MDNEKCAVPRPGVVSKNVPRSAVYEAIDSEIDYVLSHVAPERGYFETHTIGEFILMLGQYSDQAREKWTHGPDIVPGEDHPEFLHEVRKIAALAVRCMIQHGAPKRPK